MVSNLNHVILLLIVMACKVTIATPVLIDTSNPKDLENWSDTTVIWTFETVGMSNSNQTENCLYEDEDGTGKLSYGIIHHLMGESDTRSHLASKLSDRNNFSS